jgi:menaquinol-cytochrome c reductase iron-sulfur subunit
MSEMANGNGIERRAFHLTVIYGIWGLITGALAIPAGVYLLFPPKARTKEDWVEAGDVSHLKPDSPEELIFRRTRRDGWKVTSEKTSAWIVKTSSNDVIAFAPQCTHLGCGYRWDEERQNFLCPCHNSTFGIDGKVLSGPAPRPLDRYDVQLKGTELLLGAIQISKKA